MTRAAPSSTRLKIQQVALELFADQGYEATSLREIAERLGVTKAALYYHFRTKDDIVEGLVTDQAVQLDALIEWGQAQPSTVETRREFVRRYAAMIYNGEYGRFMRFLERNPTSMQKHHAGLRMREKMADVQAILTSPDAPLTDRVRRSLAILSIHTSWFTLRGSEITDEQRHEASLAVALSLVE